MNTTIHQNSLFTYLHKVKPELSDRQKEVLEVFKDGKEHTDKDIAHTLNLEINQVTGRIRELIDKGKIKEVGKIDVGGRRCRLCRIV